MSFALTPRSQINSSSKTPSRGALPTHCKCSLPAASRVSHSGNNPGRAYLNCVDRPYKGATQGCNFFAWVDEYDPPMPQEQPSQASTASTSSANDTPRGTLWSGKPAIKRKRSTSPSPTKASTAVGSSTTAGPPSTSFASNVEPRPLYTSPSPSKKVKRTHTTSEEELWGDGRDNDEDNEETQETISSVRPRDSISQVLERNKEPAVTTVPEPRTSRAVVTTPGPNTTARYGLLTPVSSEKLISRLYSSPNQQEEIDGSNKEAPRDLRAGPILVQDPENPFIVNANRPRTEPETPHHTIVKKPSIPETPTTPTTHTAIKRQDSSSALSDVEQALKKLGCEIENKDRRITALNKSIQHRDNHIKKLKEENERFRALLGLE